MYGQINDTKHIKTFISRPYGNSLDFNFDGSVGKPETRLFFLGLRLALQCCGYSLESHWRYVFNEYPLHVFYGEISKTIP